MKTVSIIIPCYNVEEYIDKCLASIINQSYTDIQVICVNDGSNDDTPKILKKFTVLDQRIKIVDQHNAGISAARNSGLKEVTGDFIMFVDADDWLDLNTITSLFENYNEEDIVIFSYIREYESGSMVKNLPLEGVFPASHIQRRLIGPLNDEKKALDTIDSFAPVWGKLYKRSILPVDLVFKNLDEIGTWEDGFFNVELLENCQEVLIVNEPFYHYRKSNDKSYTSVYNNNLQQKWIVKFKLLDQFLKDRKKNSRYFLALNNRICLTFLNLGLNELNSKCSYLVLNRKIREYLNHPFYKKAFKSFDLNFLPWYWKIFYFFTKIRFSLGISAMALAIHLIINRKNK